MLIIELNVNYVKMLIILMTKCKLFENSQKASRAACLRPWLSFPLNFDAFDILCVSRKLWSFLVFVKTP